MRSASSTIFKTTCFKTKQVEVVMKRLGSTIMKEWKFNQQQRVDWTECMTARLLNLLHAVFRSMVKRDQPKWCQNPPWNSTNVTIAIDDIETTETPVEPALACAPVDTQYHTGLDSSVNLCWRIPVDGDSTDVVMALPTTKQHLEGKADDEVLVAHFADGLQLEVPGVTVARARMMLEGTPVNARRVWEGQTEMNHALLIQQRADRQVLISLFEQSRQILQVTAKTFGDVPDRPEGKNCAEPLDPTHPAVVKAVEFLKPLAQKYATGDIGSAAALKAARDSELLSQGFKGGKRAMKAMKEQPMKAMKEQPMKAMKQQPMKAMKEQPMKSMEEQPIEAMKEQPMKAMNQQSIEAPTVPGMRVSRKRPEVTVKEQPMKAMKERPKKAMKAEKEAGDMPPPPEDLEDCAAGCLRGLEASASD